MINWFNHLYPYTNVHELNLDWVIDNVQNLLQAFEDFKGANSITFANPIRWNINTQYSNNTIVISDSGDAYLSITVVPKGIQLDNTSYWLEIFNFATYVRTANNNLTVNVELNTTRATSNYAVDDWLIWNDVLYKVTAAISTDELLIVGTNIVHFTVEDFCKAWVSYANTLITQYKNEIDASETSYFNQLQAFVDSTTASLQAQLTTAISGATVDSEVINIRVGANGITYPTAGDSVRGQVLDLRNELIDKCKKTYNVFDKFSPIIIPNLIPQGSTHKFVYSYVSSLLVIPIAKIDKKTVQYISNFDASAYNVSSTGAVFCDVLPEVDSEWLYSGASVYSSSQLRGYVTNTTNANYLVLSIVEDNAKQKEVIDLIIDNLCVAVHNDDFKSYDSYPYVDYYIVDVHNNNLSDEIEETRIKVIDDVDLRLGVELFTNEITGTYTNWSGNRYSGYTHTSGSDDAIAFDSFNTENGEVYLVEFNTTYTLGEFGEIYIGNGYHHLCYNGTNHITIAILSDGGYLKFKPKRAWNGVISNLSVKKIQNYGTSFNLDLNSVLSHGHDNLYGYWNVVLGNNCMNNADSSTRSIAIGYHTLKSLLGGHRNVALGTFAMSEVTGAESNVSIGCDSMLSVTSAEENVVIGKGALYYGPEQKENVAVGAYALVAPNSTGSEGNVAVGYQAGYNNDGNNNVFIGHKAGFDSDGSNMVIIGNSDTQDVIIGNKKLSFNNDGSVTWQTI